MRNFTEYVGRRRAVPAPERLVAIILHYFAELGSFEALLRKSG